MFLAQHARIPWPRLLVDTVHAVRGAFAWVSEHTLFGIPLDWPVRFVLLAVMYTVLRRWLSVRLAALLTIAVLLSKELFDIFAHQDLLQPRAPDWGDLADIISGLLGVAAAIGLERLRRGPRPAARASRDHTSPRQ